MGTVVHTAAYPAIPFGDFRLLEPLDRGGSSELYRALWTQPGAPETVCALKRLANELDASPTFLAMFEEEAQVLARLNHPNIVQSLGHGVCEGVPWIALEWLDGIDLGRLMRAARRRKWALPPEVAAHIAAQIARGLAHAHHAHDERARPLNLVHRDLRPANVVALADGSIKLTEFGVARASSFISPSITLSGIDRNQPVYLAPEQIRGAPPDPRSDLFSLGVLLWELLAGAPLFPPAAPREAARRVLETKLSPPSSMESEVPLELDSVVMRLLARDPRNRYASAEDAARALEALAPDREDDVRAIGMLVRSVIGTRTPTPITVSPEPVTLPLPATEASKTDLELEPLGARDGRVAAPVPRDEHSGPLVTRLKALWKALAPRSS